MAFVRLVVFGFIVLSIIYVAISLYSKSVRREKLEKTFDADHPDGGAPGARDAFIDEGMTAYKNSLRPKLIALVYVVPVVIISAIIYTTNAN